MTQQNTKSDSQSQSVFRWLDNDASDVDLINAELVIRDPAKLVGALSSAPPSNTQPTVLQEYDLPNAPDAPQRCCFCRTHTVHRKGFLCSFGSRALYLVGSTCGPKYCGLQFQQATAKHRDRKKRQDALHRLAAICDSSDALISWCDSSIFDADVKKLIAESKKLKSLAGDAYVRLRSSASSGIPLSKEVRRRDYAAEAQRPSNDRRGPIYRTDTVPIGRVQGDAFLFVDELRDDFHELKVAVRRAVSTYRAVMADSNQKTAALAKVVLETSKALRTAKLSAARISQAHNFFNETNLRNIEDWYTGTSSVNFNVSGSKLLVMSRGKLIGEVCSVPMVRFIEMPGIDVG